MVEKDYTKIIIVTLIVYCFLAGILLSVIKNDLLWIIILAGAGIILLALISNKNVRATVGKWFHVETKN